MAGTITHSQLLAEPHSGGLPPAGTIDSGYQTLVEAHAYIASSVMTRLGNDLPSVDRQCAASAFAL